MRRLSAGRGTAGLALCAGVIAALVPGGTAYATSAAAAASTTLVSVALDGTPANDGVSGQPSVSADGRYVAFTSTSPSLVPGDTNRLNDVFVRDRQAGVTTRVSVDSAGVQSNGLNGAYGAPSISADGSYVAFVSDATNLVSGDTNRRFDVFVHDMRNGFTRRVSVGFMGEQANNDSANPAISADGQFVAYESYASNLVDNDTNTGFDVFEYNLQTGDTVRASVDSNNVEGNDWSVRPSISADGRYVAFESRASNLAPSPDTNGAADIFVRDRFGLNGGRTERVSVNANGTQGDASSIFSTISADGRYVAYQSFASNLVPGDTNDNCDDFLFDRWTSTVTQLNVLPTGERDPGGAPQAVRPSISADGRDVAFEYSGDSLVSNDYNHAWDVFVRDRDTATMTRASVADDGTEANSSSFKPAISADGKHVAFQSFATNFAPGASQWAANVYMRDLAG